MIIYPPPPPPLEKEVVINLKKKNEFLKPNNSLCGANWEKGFVDVVYGLLLFRYHLPLVRT